MSIQPPSQTSEEREGTKRAECPLVDNRRKFGEYGPCLSLPSIEDHELSLPIGFHRRVMFAHPGNGYAHDGQHAQQWLIPGRIYKTIRIEVGRSSSRVELADFPGVWFNTVMFCDWPPAALCDDCGRELAKSGGAA